MRVHECTSVVCMHAFMDIYIAPHRD